MTDSATAKSERKVPASWLDATELFASLQQNRASYFEDWLSAALHILVQYERVPASGNTPVTAKDFLDRFDAEFKPPTEEDIREGRFHPYR